MRVCDVTVSKAGLVEGDEVVQKGTERVTLPLDQVYVMRDDTLVARYQGFWVNASEADNYREAAPCASA